MKELYKSWAICMGNICTQLFIARMINDQYMRNTEFPTEYHLLNFQSKNFTCPQFPKTLSNSSINVIPCSLSHLLMPPSRIHTLSIYYSLFRFLKSCKIVVMSESIPAFSKS